MAYNKYKMLKLWRTILYNTADIILNFQIPIASNKRNIEINNLDFLHIGQFNKNVWIFLSSISDKLLITFSFRDLEKFTIKRSENNKINNQTSLITLLFIKLHAQ